MMRKFVLFLFCSAVAVSNAHADTITREQIIENADRLADAQLKVLGDSTKLDWVAGTFYAGLADYLRVSPNQAEYRKAMASLGERSKWTPRLNPKSPLHADDLCIGMAFEEASADANDPALIAPLKARLDTLAAHLEEPFNGKLTWWWCDALFMAPRDMARMSNLTGDTKYINAMDKEYWRTIAALYDPQEHLVFRDGSYLKKQTKNGRKVFWSRGEGWVIAGLARVLAYMPADYPARGKYVQLFKDLAAKLASLQSPDGTWHPSLLDSEEIDTPETSGTALDCFALSWGMNNGLLPKQTYLPVVIKAYTAMVAAERPDGLPGYVQQEGASPAKFKTSTTRLYASGAYLMTAVELLKLVPIERKAEDTPKVKIEPAPMPPPGPTTKP
jgi:rhamnogalacturonyl hydrolase YesR